MQPPRLWHFRISHYNEKVRWALDYKRWPHRRRALVPGFHVPRARWLSGQNALPVLELDGRAIADSSAILAEIERLRPDPPLFPADPAERGRALAIEDWFDEQVAPALRRLFWSCYVGDARATTRMACAGAGAATRISWRILWPALRPVFRANMGLGRAALERARADLGGFFDQLEAEIGPSGYLVGDRFSLADLGAAAVMTAIIRPAQFSYPLPEPWPRALVELRESIAHRDGCRWVLEIYARHRGTSHEVA